MASDPVTWAMRTLTVLWTIWLTPTMQVSPLSWSSGDASRPRHRLQPLHDAWARGAEEGAASSKEDLLRTTFGEDIPSLREEFRMRTGKETMLEPVDDIFWKYRQPEMFAERAIAEPAEKDSNRWLSDRYDFLNRIPGTGPGEELTRSPFYENARRNGQLNDLTRLNFDILSSAGTLSHQLKEDIAGRPVKRSDFDVKLPGEAKSAEDFDLFNSLRNDDSRIYARAPFNDGSDLVSEARTLRDSYTASQDTLGRRFSHYDVPRFSRQDSLLLSTINNVNVPLRKGLPSTYQSLDQTAPQLRLAEFSDDSARRRYGRKSASIISPLRKESWRDAAYDYDKLLRENAAPDYIDGENEVGNVRSSPRLTGSTAVKRRAASKHASLILRLYRPEKLQTPVSLVALEKQKKMRWLQEKLQNAKPLRHAKSTSECVPESRVLLPMKCPSDPTICLQEAMFCDGVTDCPGGEDETSPVCILRHWAFRWLRHFQSFFQLNGQSQRGVSTRDSGKGR